MILFWLTLIILSFIGLYFIRVVNSSWLKKISYASIFLILVASGYFYFGHSAQYADYLNIQMQAKALVKSHGVPEVTARIHAHLKKQPKDSKGWFLLGKLYLRQGKYAQSVEALSKANALQPDNDVTLMTLAEALFFENHQRLTQPSKQIIIQVQSREPKNLQALNLLALDAYGRQDYSKAIDYWQQLLQFYSSDSDDGKAILAAMADARSKQMH